MDKEYTPVLRMLSEKGINAYIVGGYPRDILLGFLPKDIDLASPNTPQEIILALDDLVIEKLTKKTVNYGVINFRFQNETFEIATFRVDLDQKRNTSVAYTTKMDVDALRRDFTINSLYLDKDGVFHDPTEKGIEDIENKVLRTVGLPLTRFREDPSRILRAVRFETMGFEPEVQLKVLLKRSFTSKMLEKVSQERITKEFLKILSIDAQKGISILREYNFLKIILPEIEIAFDFDQENPRHRFDLFSHMSLAAQFIQKHGGSPVLILTGLLHDIGKPETKRWNEKRENQIILVTK